MHFSYITYMTDKKGYTIVEVLMVIAMLSLVLSIAIPSSKIIDSFYEKKELMEFKNHIVTARNDAILENSTHILYLDIATNSYKIIKIQELKSITVVNITLEKGIVLKNNNLNNSVKFYSNGTPSLAGTILLTNSKKEKIEITISPATGKVHLYINK